MLHRCDFLRLSALTTLGAAVTVRRAAAVGSLGQAPSLTELSSGFPLIEALKEGNIVNARQRVSPRRLWC